MGIVCKQCGIRDVEKTRECYATPVCYRCLPPPAPLPVRYTVSQEQAIRADERAKVEREVVQFLERRTEGRGLFQSVAAIIEELQRGEHRQKAGT